MPPSEKSFLGRVRDALPSLHPAERRLGEFVCDFPGELASYSGSELAELAHVSKATVSRFVQRLGYDSYESARRHAREEKQTGSRLFLASAAKAGAVQTVQAHIAQGIANADKIKAELDAIEAKRQSILAEAHDHAAKLIEEGRKAAADVQQQETQKAIAAAGDIVDKAREAMAREHERMLGELKREVGRLVVQTTASVTGKILTPEDQRRLSEETAKQVAAGR